jgi:hypothetical protein
MLIRWSLLPLVVASAMLIGRPVAAQTAASPQVTYVEQFVTTHRPVQQRVIVPVVEYRERTRLQGLWNPTWVTQRVPVTRWEERIQTSYIPETRRTYRPIIETSGRQLQPVQLAERPRNTTAVGTTPKALRLYDDPPVVAIELPPPGKRTAQQPNTTLQSREFKPGR